MLLSSMDILNKYINFIYIESPSQKTLDSLKVNEIPKLIALVKNENIKE